MDTSIEQADLTTSNLVSLCRVKTITPDTKLSASIHVEHKMKKNKKKVQLHKLENLQSTSAPARVPRWLISNHHVNGACQQQ